MRVVLFGMGNRARKYLRHLFSRRDCVEVAAIVDCDACRLDEGAEEFGLSRDVCFLSDEAWWNSGITADAAIVATTDNSHYDIAMEVLRRGMALLLEKPMAVTEQQCLELTEAAARSAAPAGLCYVLRYHPYFNRIRELSALQGLGRIRAVHHKVIIGIDRMTHTFVRGLWSRAEDSSPIFLSKACHDVDWLFSLAGCRDIDEVESIDSEGSLTRYCAAAAPEGAAARCISCPLEKSCRYSAVDLYSRRGEWTDNFIPSDGETKEDVIERELRGGDYGRCVFHCDNDVEDYFRAEFRLRGGVVLDVTMDGISGGDGREIVIETENGRIEASGGQIDVFKRGEKVLSEDWREVCGRPFHAGADFGVVDDFIAAVCTGSRMRSPLSDALPATIACLRACDGAGKLRRESREKQNKASIKNKLN